MWMTIAIFAIYLHLKSASYFSAVLSTFSTWHDAKLNTAKPQRNNTTTENLKLTQQSTNHSELQIAYHVKRKILKSFFYFENFFSVLINSNGYRSGISVNRQVYPI